jgi:hypothetical protein
VSFGGLRFGRVSATGFSVLVSVLRYHMGCDGEGWRGPDFALSHARKPSSTMNATTMMVAQMSVVVFTVLPV